MISKVYSQNVHKNKLWTDHLLETLKDDTDIIMIQEPPHRHIKDIPSGKSKEGEPEHDTSHHSQWAKIYFNTNVSVYINNKLLRTHTLFIFPSFDPNIIAFTLQSQDSLERFNFINCYNDPSKGTIQALGDFLEREELSQLVLMGDFNLHSPKWDLQVERPDAKAELLSTRTTSAGLVLLNDVDKPTWTQPGKEPSVIDLAFVHMDLYEKHIPTLEVDLDNRAADHASLSLQLNRIQPAPSLKKALPRASKPYLAFIEEAKIILTHAESYSLEETCEKISQGFEAHSIQRGKSLPSWILPASSKTRRTPPHTTPLCKSKFKTPRRAPFRTNYSRHPSHSWASPDDAFHGRFLALLGSAQRASSGATPPTSANHAPPHAINVRAPTSPPIINTTRPNAKTARATTLASSVSTATKRTPPRACRPRSSETAATRASSKSSRRRESTDSAVVHLKGLAP